MPGLCGAAVKYAAEIERIVNERRRQFVAPTPGKVKQNNGVATITKAA
jgi:hypothetical protein